MNYLEVLVVGLAGLVAGLLGAVVGNGTLVSFPALLLAGIPPITANVTNGLGLVAGSVSAAVGMREGYAGQRTLMLKVGICTALGAVGGAVLLLCLPPAAFAAITPVLLGIALVLVVIQPWLARRLRQQRPDRDVVSETGLLCCTFGIAIYGGYFGGGQGLLYLVAFSLLIRLPMPQVQALKVFAVLVANGLSATTFVLDRATVAWWAVAALAVGSTVGGLLGVRVGKRIPAKAMRAVIVVIGSAALVKVLVT